MEGIDFVLYILDLAQVIVWGLVDWDSGCFWRLLYLQRGPARMVLSGYIKRLIEPLVPMDTSGRADSGDTAAVSGLLLG